MTRRPDQRARRGDGAAEPAESSSAPHAVRARGCTALRVGLTALGALALVACGTIDTYRWPIDRPAPAAARPAVYFEGSLPSTGMQELELVEVVGSGTKAYVEDVIGAMQDEAQRYGANALVRVKVDCGHGTCHGYGVAVRFVAPP